MQLPQAVANALDAGGAAYRLLDLDIPETGTPAVNVCSVVLQDQAGRMQALVPADRTSPHSTA